LNQHDARGGDRSKSAAGGTFAQSKRQAANDAGLSPRRQRNATNVANLSDDQFNGAIECDRPATVTALAEMGTKRRQPHCEDRRLDVMAGDAARSPPWLSIALTRTIPTALAMAKAPNLASVNAVVLREPNRRIPVQVDRVWIFGVHHAIVVRRHNSSRQPIVLA